MEFYPIFCVPFGFLAGNVLVSRKRFIKILFFILVICMTAFNFSLSLVASRCNFGSTWDWNYYAKQLKRIYLLPRSTLPFTFTNDFENRSIYNGTMVTDSVSNSGIWSAILDKNYEICCEHSVMVRDFKGEIPKFITVQLMVRKVEPGPVEAWLVCSFEENNEINNRQMQRLKLYSENTRSWIPVFWTFYVPNKLSGDTKINFYVWNKEKKSFFVDDLMIRYE